MRQIFTKSSGLNRAKSKSNLSIRQHCDCIHESGSHNESDDVKQFLFFSNIYLSYECVSAAATISQWKKKLYNISVVCFFFIIQWSNSSNAKAFVFINFN